MTLPRALVTAPRVEPDGEFIRCGRRRVPLAQRFWAKVHVTARCWEWTGKWRSNGYGIIKVGDHGYIASRIAWLLSNGPIPEGLDVLHRCDNPLCVNPDHLFLGTHTDNMRDMAAKGRRASFRGEKNGLAKLTPELVAEIRRLRAETGMYQRALAKRFRVTQSTIWAVLNRRRWVDV